MSGTYTHGHHESVLRSHMWRTAANSAGYLLPHLSSGDTLLDVGCGPGTITADLAALVGPGLVVGIDASAEVISAASSAYPDVEFATGDVYALEAEAASFDVVHAHQVLQHLADPVAALVEMRRVVRTDGVVAVRDSIYSSAAWAPEDPLLTRWNELYHDVARRNGGEPGAGSRLIGWARAAGFSEVVASSSTWTYSEPADRAWWGGLWADRMTVSAIAEQAVAEGMATADELEAIAEAFRNWADQPDGIWIVVSGEILARR